MNAMSCARVFSTSGQWLWDEIEVPIPAGVDPYPIAEAVHKAVVAETQANMGLAEKEWQRAIPMHVGKTFAPAPAIMVRPTTAGRKRDCPLHYPR